MTLKKMTFFILSWVIVAFGQPSLIKSFCIPSALFGFALFFLSIWPYERKKRFWISSAWFFLVSLVQLSWLTSDEYHGIYIWFVYAGVAIWFALGWGIFCYFLPRDKKISFSKLFSLAGLWTLIEWSRLFVFCGFPLNPIGMTFTSNLWTLQWASVGGVLGLSFCVMAINLLFLRALRTTFAYYGAALGLFFSLGGGLYFFHEQKSKTAESLSVALVQTGLKPEEKVPNISRLMAFISPFQQWKQIIRYLQKGDLHSLDYVALPEAALPYGAYVNIYDIEIVKAFLLSEIPDFDLSSLPPTQGKVGNAYIAQALANYTGAEWIVGLDDEDEDQRSFNAAFHFLPSGESATRYEKQVLVPLAEYLPLSFLQPLVSKYGITHFFTHGEGPKIFQGKSRISPSICYEECFSHLMRKGRSLGATLFVNMTNDNYYPNSLLPDQHFDHGRVRTVENGVPVLRACNTGITAGIDSLGRVVGKFEEKGEAEWAKGALFLSLSTYHYFTLYSLWGDAFIVLVSVSLILIKKNKRLLKKKSWAKFLTTNYPKN